MVRRGPAHPDSHPGRVFRSYDTNRDGFSLLQMGIGAGSGFGRRSEQIGPITALMAPRSEIGRPPRRKAAPKIYAEISALARFARRASVDLEQPVAATMLDHD